MRKAVLLVVILTCVMLSGCFKSNPAITPTTLVSPTTVTFTEDYSVTWNKVSNAVSYVIEINGVCYETSDNFWIFDVSETLEFGVRIKSVGDGEYYVDSDYGKLYSVDYKNFE